MVVRAGVAMAEGNPWAECCTFLCDLEDGKFGVLEPTDAGQKARERTNSVPPRVGLFEEINAFFPEVCL
jgi:hypothetical protein